MSVLCSQPEPPTAQVSHTVGLALATPNLSTPDLAQAGFSRKKEEGMRGRPAEVSSPAEGPHIRGTI